MKYSVEGFYCPEWLKRIVDGISYKPGWELRIHARTYDMGPQTYEPYQVNIAAICTVEDVVTRNPIMLHGPYISIYTDHKNDEKMVVEMIFRCIRELEHHEMEEQFSYNGVRIFDPHRSRQENEKLFDLVTSPMLKSFQRTLP